MCEGGDGTRTTHGVDLVDPQERCRRQDCRVHAVIKFTLRRGHEGNRRHTRNLGGNNIHDHAGWVDRATTRDVESDAAHRHPALFNARSRAEDGVATRRHLGQ